MQTNASTTDRTQRRREPRPQRPNPKVLTPDPVAHKVPQPTRCASAARKSHERKKPHAVGRYPLLIHEITKEECQESLKRANFGRLGCARDDQPYVVPISFAFEEDYAYAFSMPGQKIEWMRDNPHVCLEVDTVKTWNDWTSVVGLGRYEELSDTPEFWIQREHARKLLDARATWWLPGSVALEGETRDRKPIVYRIYLERMTGRRGVPAPDETTEVLA